MLGLFLVDPVPLLLVRLAGSLLVAGLAPGAGLQDRLQHRPVQHRGRRSPWRCSPRSAAARAEGPQAWPAAYAATVVVSVADRGAAARGRRPAAGRGPALGRRASGSSPLVAQRAADHVGGAARPAGRCGPTRGRCRLLVLLAAAAHRRLPGVRHAAAPPPDARAAAGLHGGAWAPAAAPTELLSQALRHTRALLAADVRPGRRAARARRSARGRCASAATASAARRTRRAARASSRRCWPAAARAASGARHAPTCRGAGWLAGAGAAATPSSSRSSARTASSGAARRASAWARRRRSPQDDVRPARDGRRPPRDRPAQRRPRRAPARRGDARRAHRAAQPRAVRRARSPPRSTSAARGGRSPSCSWTSTASRTSTTRSATRPATRCSSQVAPPARRPPSPPTSPSRGSAATSSRCSCRSATGGPTSRRRRRGCTTRCARPCASATSSSRCAPPSASRVCPRARRRQLGAAAARRRRDVRRARPRSCPLQMYSAEIDRSNPRRLALVNDLRAAVEDGQLTCHYQPKVRVADTVGHRRRGARALAAPGARQRAAGRLHPDRRAHRPHRPADRRSCCGPRSSSAPRGARSGTTSRSP